MILSIIAAMDRNRLIGNNNQLPWHLPADLQHFKSLTMGKPILMGRKTYESIGRILPGRKNIIISRQMLQIAGAQLFPSLHIALQALQREKEIMIIGGASIFQEALSLANKMYLTMIDHAFEGDTFFPEWQPHEWKELSREHHPADIHNQYSFDFIELSRD